MKNILRVTSFLLFSVFIAIFVPQSVSAAPSLVALSNLPQANDVSNIGISPTQHVAVVFTTNATSYTLADVTMRVSYVIAPPMFPIFNPSAAASCSLDLALYTFTGSTRGTLISAIGSANIPSLSASDVVVSPSSTITLAPNTAYWINATVSGTDCEGKWHESSSAPVAPSGIYTHNDYFASTNSGSTWSISTDGAYGLKIQVVGEPVTETPVEAVVEQVLTPDLTALGCDVTTLVENAPDNTYCRVLMQNGGVVKFPGAVPQNLIDLGVIVAVDVYRLQGGQSVTDFGGYSQICLAGEGRLFYLDARTSPRVQVELVTETDGDFTCGWIPAAGTLVLTN